MSLTSSMLGCTRLRHSCANYTQYVTYTVCNCPMYLRDMCKEVACAQMCKLTDTLQPLKFPEHTSLSKLARMSKSLLSFEEDLRNTIPLNRKYARIPSVQKENKAEQSANEKRRCFLIPLIGIYGECVYDSLAYTFIPPRHAPSPHTQSRTIAHRHCTHQTKTQTHTRHYRCITHLIASSVGAAILKSTPQSAFRMGSLIYPRTLKM